MLVDSHRFYQIIGDSRLSSNTRIYAKRVEFESRSCDLRVSDNKSKVKAAGTYKPESGSCDEDGDGNGKASVKWIVM